MTISTPPQFKVVRLLDGRSFVNEVPLGEFIENLHHDGVDVFRVGQILPCYCLLVHVMSRSLSLRAKQVPPSQSLMLFQVLQLQVFVSIARVIRIPVPGK